MSAVCKEVGLSQGSIYNYFTDKDELAFEVISEYADRQVDMLLSVRPSGDAFTRIFEVNLAYFRYLSINVGLWHAMRQLCDELPAFRDLWHRKNYGWSLLIAQGLQRRTGTRNWDATLFLARSLGLLVDEILYELFIRRSPEFAHMAKDLEELARVTSIYWYRMAYAANPVSESLPEDHPILDICLDRPR